MALGTTLGSFLPLLHDLSSYKGISNLSDIRMLRRATEDSDWEEYPNQSVVGNTIVCTAVGAFSQWVPDSVGGDALPVELTSFTAKSINNSILLAWQTATEVNNYGFEIQRQNQVSSIENQDKNQSWENIGFVEGHGNSNSPRDYSFIDENPLQGITQYRLKQMDTDGGFEYSKIIEVELDVPTKFELSQNYPNPFNPTTTIQYSIPSIQIPLFGGVRGGLVTLKIYNTLGQEVATLVNEKQTPGKYEVEFNAEQLTSGIYIYRLVSGEFISSKKLLLLK
ncbi:MAG: T9SS type A sorting domain-containing protein [Melioribacteraceae bacterium]|jgi:hypothetical protein|nr:T9SS type A sorting domain-containing protein [Melioribacteraceae bacterium]